MISTLDLMARSNSMVDFARPSTAQALTLEPRRAVLQALRTWAAEQNLDAGDLAALDRVVATLASAEDGPDLDLAMRTARRRVIVRARHRPGRMASG